MPRIPAPIERFGLLTQICLAEVTPRTFEHFSFIMDMATYFNAGLYASALAEIDTKLTLTPEIPELYYYRAVANYHLNNLTEMLIDARLSQRRDSYVNIVTNAYIDKLKQIPPSVFLATIIAESNIDNKIILLTSCLESDNIFGNIFLTHDFQQQIVTELVIALRRRGAERAAARKPNEALADYNLAIRYNPTFSTLYNFRALVHCILGNSAAMRADLAMLKILNPSMITSQIYPKKMPVTPVVKKPDYSALHKPLSDAINSFLNDYTSRQVTENQSIAAENTGEITYSREPIIRTHAEFISHGRLFPGIDYMIEAKPTEDANAGNRFTK